MRGMVSDMSIKPMLVSGSVPIDRTDRVLATGLMVFALFIRLATLMPIHTGVDERDYWLAAKAIARRLPYPELTHRTVRFAVILPTAAAQSALGSGSDVYYVTPVLNAAIQAVLFYFLGRRLRSRGAGFLASMGITLFPYMIRAGSQVRPEVFSVTYVAAAFLTFLTFLDRKEKSVAPILSTGILLFIAYEAKITNLFFLPGFMLAAYLSKRKFLPAILLGAVPFALFLAETGLYAILTRYPFGQLQVIAANHLEGNGALHQMRFIDLFARYSGRYLQAYWQIPFAAFAVIAGLNLRRRRDLRLLFSCILPGLSFFFFLTFAVKSLDPVVPAEPFINRYFSAVLVPVIVALAVVLSDILSFVSSGSIARGRSIGTPHYLAGLGIFTAAFLTFSAFFPLPRSLRVYMPSPLHPSEHPLSVNLNNERAVKNAWDSGTPIVSRGEKAGGDVGAMNAAWTCSVYFLDASRYRNGVPPRPVRAEIRGIPIIMLADRQNLVKGNGEEVLIAIRNPFRLKRFSVSALESEFDEEHFPKSTTTCKAGGLNWPLKGAFF